MYRSRNNSGDHELVVIDGETTLAVRIDGNGLVLLPLIVGGAGAGSPFGVRSLGVIEAGRGGEVRAGSFYRLKIGLFLATSVLIPLVLKMKKGRARHVGRHTRAAIAVGISGRVGNGGW